MCGCFMQNEFDGKIKSANYFFNADAFVSYNLATFFLERNNEGDVVFSCTITYRSDYVQKRFIKLLENNKGIAKLC